MFERLNNLLDEYNMYVNCSFFRRIKNNFMVDAAGEDEHPAYTPFKKKENTDR